MGEIYIGRNRKLGDGFWGNKHKASCDSEARVAVAGFESDLRSSDTLLRALPSLSGKGLVCHCPAGAPCHADALVKVYREHFEIAESESVITKAEKDRLALADKDTSDEDASGRARLPLGSGHWGKGRPLFYYIGNKKNGSRTAAAFAHPGAGIQSIVYRTQATGAGH